MMKSKMFTSRSTLIITKVFFVLFIASIYSCKKDLVGSEASLAKLNGSIEIVHADTAVTLVWNKALTAWEGERIPEVSYEINVSLDSTFQDEVKGVFNSKTDSLFIELNEEQLVPLQIYFARVRAIAGENSAASAWVNTQRFHILDEVPKINVFRLVRNHELIDKAALLRWKKEDGVTRIVITSDEIDFRKEITLSADDRSKTQKLVDGLVPNTMFKAQLFAGSKSMGDLSFRTKSGVDGAGFIDLRSLPQTVDVLINALDNSPSGSTIVLKRGALYSDVGYAFDRSITIMSEPGFGEPAHIQVASSFDIKAGSQIDSIMFNDVKVSGNIGGSYVFNLSSACTVNKIVIENCLISEHRGVVRIKASDPVSIESYVVNNSIIENVGNYGIINVDNAAAKLQHIRLTNSTINNANKLIVSKSNSSSIIIGDVTFYLSPGNGSYVFDYNGVEITDGVSIYNSLFGKATGARNFRAKGSPISSVKDTYSTNDYRNDLIPGVGSYPKSSAEVFIAPDNGNFTIKDEGLYMNGDPRWRP